MAANKVVSVAVDSKAVNKVVVRRKAAVPAVANKVVAAVSVVAVNKVAAAAVVVDFFPSLPTKWFE